MATQVMATPKKKESKNRVKAFLGAIGAALLTYQGLSYTKSDHPEELPTRELAEYDALTWGAWML
jgi:hypothetical protein